MPERAVDEELERSTTRWMAAGIVLTALFVLMFPRAGARLGLNLSPPSPPKARTSSARLVRRVMAPTVKA